MIWTKHPPQERNAGGAGLPDQLLSLLASLVSYFRARLELAGLEGKEALGAYAKVAGWLIVAIGLTLFGYAFLWIGLIAVVSIYVPVYWGWVVLGAGVVHLLGVIACLCLAKSKAGKPVFSATLEEFRKDEEWLNRSQQTENRS